MNKPTIPNEYIEALREFVGEHALYGVRPKRERTGPPRAKSSALSSILTKKLWVLALVLLTGACSHGYNIVDATSENELLVVAETSRYAGLMGVKVRGEVTDTLYLVGQQYAAGWYLSGVAYYYRPALESMTTELVSDVAAHEVCHAVTGSNHDLAHWECMNKWAHPTYPRP